MIASVTTAATLLVLLLLQWLLDKKAAKLDAMAELGNRVEDLRMGLTNALGRIETLEKQSRELSTMASRLREDRQHGPQRGGAQSWQNFVAPIRRQAEEAPIANRTAGE